MHNRTQNLCRASSIFFSKRWIKSRADKKKEEEEEEEADNNNRWPLGRYYIDACKCLTHR
jgi:hypothetical protein